MSFDLGALLNTVKPVATAFLGGLGGANKAHTAAAPAAEGAAPTAQIGKPNLLQGLFGGILGGGAGAAVEGAANAQADAAPIAGQKAGGSQALSGLGSLLKTVDFTDVARMVNPNLPREQVDFFKQLGPYVGTFVQGVTGGGGDSAVMGQVADPAKAGQYPGTPDEITAKINAQKVINQIDWSKPKIAIWVPGTGSHGMDPSFARTIGKDTSAVAIAYPATVDFPGSVSTGMLTTKLVLEEIERRGRTASLAGYSQGAWVAAEVMADPKASKTVTRAALFGHPSSANAQYDNGENPKVRVINNPTEQLANMSTSLDPVAGISNLVRGRIDGQSILGTLSGFITHANVVEQMARGPVPVGQGHSYDLGSQAAWLRG